MPGRPEEGTVVRSVLMVLALAILLLCLWGETAGSQSAAGSERGPADARVVEFDSNLVFTPLDEHDLLARRLEENTARPLTSYLAVSADRFYGIERYELSTTQCALFGADTGLTFGLIAGALGMTAGLWGEETAWYIAGAAAALGAFQGLSKADDPGFRIRLRWDDSE
jgi:hypothetical protein